MTPRDDMDRRLSAWLTATAPVREPEPLLGTILARTARTRRRAGWRIPERWIPMSITAVPVTRTGGFPWRTAALLAVLLVVLASAVFLVGSRAQRPAPPFGLARNGLLAYSQDGDIVTMDAAGGTPRTIVAGGETDQAPWFFRDGTRLLFLRGADQSSQSVMVTDASGSDVRTLGGPFDRITWVEPAPAGDVVAVSSDGDRAAITLLPVAGGEPTRIDTGLMAADEPIFRPPDGATITFRGLAADGTWGLYRVARDGTNVHRLELDAGFQDDPEYAADRDYYFQGAAWSPDGRTLAYYTLEPAPTSPAGPGYRIHIADIDATGVVVADHKLEFVADRDDEFKPVWMPNATDIVFQTVEGLQHGLFRASVVPTIGPPVDLGMTANDYIDVTPAPDGTELLTIGPVQGTAGQAVALLRLADGATAALAPGGTDLTWQRLAP